MRFLPIALAASAAIVVAACEGPEVAEDTEPEAAITNANPAEPVTADPESAPGVTPEELATRREVYDIGTATRALVRADDIAEASEAVAMIERQVVAARQQLPEALSSEVQDDIESAREAIEAGDLRAARVAGDSILDRIRSSPTLTDPTLVRPGQTTE